MNKKSIRVVKKAPLLKLQSEHIGSKKMNNVSIVFLHYPGAL